MKQLGIIILAFLSHISVALALALPVTSPAQLNALVDSAFTSYQTRHQDDWTTEKKALVLAKATTYLQTTQDSSIKTALAYLITLLGERDPTVTPPETNHYLSQDTTTYETGPKTLLAGVESPIIAKLSYIAQNEAILIDTFVITGTRSLADYFAAIYIYDAQGKRVQTFLPSTDRIEIDGLAWKLPQGQNTFWVTVVPKVINNTSTAHQVSNISLTFSPTRLISSTNHTTSVSTQRTVSDVLTISPTIIGSIAFVDEAVQRKRDTHLINGTTNLGIIALTTPTRQNTWETASTQSNLRLWTLRLHVNDSTITQQIKPTLMLRRLWTSMTALSWTIDGDAVLFDLSAQATYAQQKPGTTTYRLVTTTPQLSAGSLESAQLVFADFLSWAISYGSDEPGSDAIAQLNLPENTIEWPIVYE